MAKNEAKIRFTAETSEFNDSIKKSNDSTKELSAELKLNDERMKTTGKSVEGLEEKHRILSEQLETAESKTEALNQKMNKAAEIYGEDSAEVSKLRTQLLNAQTAEEKIKQAIDKCNSELEEQKNAADGAETETKQLDKALEDAGETSVDVGDKFSKLAIGVAAAGAAMVAAGKEAIEAFNEVDEGADNVIKATGATGEAAAELEESYKNVASSIVGEFGNIGSTLGEVNTRFGYTGSEAEEATTKFLKFAEITGVDSVAAVQSVTRALNDSGIPLSEYDTLLDQLAKAGQTAGIDVTTLADSLSENGSIMRSMGFDTQETIALLAQFELSGANSSAMLGGMKKAMASWADSGKDGGAEFAKMVEGIKNGSVTAADAIDVFGTKAGPMLVDAIQSGKFEYKDLLSVIEGSEGTLETTFDSTVDGGYELELAMQNAKMAMAEAGEEIGTALTPVFQAFSENILPVATEAISEMVDAISSAVGWMKEHQGVMIAVASVVGVLATAITAYNAVQAVKTAMDAAQVTTVWGLVAAHWAQATAAMAALAPYLLVVAAIAAVIAIIVLLIKNWDDVVAKCKEVWEQIKATLSQWGEWINANVIQPIKTFFSGIWDGITETASSVWNSIVEVVSSVWETIKNAVQVGIMFIGSLLSAAFDIITLPFRFIWENCKDIIIEVWEAIKAGVTAYINAVKSIVTTVFNAVKNFIETVWNAVVDFLKPILETIKNAITTAWNAIKNAVTTAVNAVKNAVTKVWTAIKDATTTAWNAVKTAISTVWNGIKSGVSTAINAVKNTVSNVFNGIKNTATNVWNKIKDAITKPIEKARDTIKGIIDKIKGFFSGMKLEFPKIKMPHFKIEGKFSLDPPSVPKLAIDWYAEGGILTRPTIFGMNGNHLMAGGEAGAEAILPIEKLEGYIAGAIEKTMNVVNLAPLADAIEELANRPVVMNINGRQFATATAGDGDSVNGLRSTFKSRGLVLD